MDCGLWTVDYLLVDRRQTIDHSRLALFINLSNRSINYELYPANHGLWSMVHGLWSMVHGLWSMDRGLFISDRRQT